MMFLFLQIAIAQPKVIGNAEYCVLSPIEIQCVDHTMNQCLRTLYLTIDGIMCIKKEEIKGK